MLGNFLRNRKATGGAVTQEPEIEQTFLSTDIEVTISRVEASMGSSELVVHRFKVFSCQANGTLMYLKSLVDSQELSTSILSPLLKLTSKPNNLKDIAEQDLPQTGISQFNSVQDLKSALAWGEAILLISGFDSGLKIPLKQIKYRQIVEPEAEKVVRGPRDGFIESLWANMGLLRQRIKNPDLKLEVITLGSRSSVEIGIVYVQGLANPKIVNEVRSRLSKVNADRILSAGELNEFVVDSPWSPFPTIQFTERPDRLTNALLDGRVAIMMDGTPVVLIVPAVFWDFLKASDDYIENPYFASFIRIVRLGGHLVTLLFPASFVALTTIHMQMMPQSLAVIVAGARARAPLPVSVEILAMELTVEVLREAGLRLPGVFGQTISIVGALVIGESAVTAGLVGPATVVVVAFTTLASFMVPGYNAAVAIRLLRFPLILLGASLGFFGIIIGAMFYLVYLVSLRSFGVPYLAPVAPLMLKDLEDTFVRLPWWALIRRPSYYRPQNTNREARKQKPGPKES